jgi:soluble lytic murein transglycosylase
MRKPMLVAALRFIALTLALGTCTATAADLADQRSRFILVWEAAQHGPDAAWRKLAAGLESYPLFPYLELAALERRHSELKTEEVEKFLARWPDSLPEQLLRQSYLAELARRQDWKNFLALYAGNERGRELQCNAVQAQLALGRVPDFERDIAPLWLSPKALPAACDNAFQWARDHGKLTPDLIWQRIDAAAQAAQGDLVASLATMLDGAERTAAEHTAAAIHDPAAALADASNWPDATHTRDAIALAVTRLARKDSDGAAAQWTQLEPHFHFDADQRGRILRAIAVYSASSYAPDALARLNAVPSDADDDTSREWRVRVALARQDWKGALQALDRMSPAQQADARWRYLRGRALVKLDRKKEAEPIFSTISREANFHAFLAADWLDQPYTICSTPSGADAKTEAAVRAEPGLARAFEFFALDRLSDARHEWDFTLPKLDASQRRIASEIASQIGWYDRAVYALNQGEDLHLYELRFPLARRDQIERDSRAADIDSAWTYAIIRAESAWTIDAHSGADAYGLMQLLPGTARQLAKAEKLPFSGPTQLYDPDINIQLGTRYLGDMAVRYDGSPWLASAAYNAGVEPVGRWVDARDSLEPDFFIETIPYKETREYVARVLAFSVIYDWRLHGTALPLASRLPRIGQAYEPPGANAPRKAVVCPAPVATVPAPTSAQVASSPAPQAAPKQRR